MIHHSLTNLILKIIFINIKELIKTQKIIHKIFLRGLKI